VLEREGWQGKGLTEDVHAWLILVSRGIRPRYEPSASLVSTMPTTREAARVQRSRWEAGRVELVRVWLAPGLRQALKRRDFVLLEALVSELVFPPLSTLGALVVAAGMVRFAADRSLRSSAVQLGVLGTHAIAALVVYRAPVSSYGALLLAPLVVTWKISIKLELAMRGVPEGWRRTPRRSDNPECT
jgi:hypothetical protein